jgi:hypothetical protein
MKRIRKFSVVVPAVQVGVGVALGTGVAVGAGVALCTGVGAGAIVGAGVGAVGTGVGVETGALGVAVGAGVALATGVAVGVAVGLAVGLVDALGVGEALPLVEMTGVIPEFTVDPAADASSKNCLLGLTIQPVMMRLTESKPRVDWIDDFIKNSFTDNPYLNCGPETDELQGFLNNIELKLKQLNDTG